MKGGVKPLPLEPHPPCTHPNHPIIPFNPPHTHPKHFHSPTHSNRVAAALSSYTNIPTERGQKTIYPLFLTNLLPLLIGGCNGGEKSILLHFIPSYLLPVFPPPSFTQSNTHKHTHMNIHTHAN